MIRFFVHRILHNVPDAGTFSHQTEWDEIKTLTWVSHESTLESVWLFIFRNFHGMNFLLENV